MNLKNMIDTEPTIEPKRYWRSLNELADKPAFRDWMSREFPTAGSELPDTVSRRRWMQLMGASLAFGGIAGCRWEAEEFAPFTVRPQNRIPGEKQYFASSWELAGTGRPLTVTSIDGRPIKVDGNKLHPFTGGGTDAFDQASILALYDPDRSDGLIESIGNAQRSRTWEEFDSAMAGRVGLHGQRRGAGLAILCGPSSSLTRQRLQQLVMTLFPKAVWCEHEPTFSRSQADGSRLAFGECVRTQHDFSKAKVIACFDADPMGAHPAAMKMIRDWADRRDPDSDWMNRLYAFESDMSLTGSNADHRAGVRSVDIPALIARLETLIVSELKSADGRRLEEGDPATRMLAALADDLVQHRGESLLVAGPHQPAEVHARIHRLNDLLSNVGTTTTYSIDPLTASLDTSLNLSALVDQMESGQVETLLVLESNPAFGQVDSPRFVKALSKVQFSIHAGVYRDETSSVCRWHVPTAHFLESWGDCRSWDGTATLAQPLIAPLFGGRTTCELLSLLTRTGLTESEQLVRKAFMSWSSESVKPPREAVRLKSQVEWRKAVHDGFVDESAFAVLEVGLVEDLNDRLTIGQLTAAEQAPSADQIEVIVEVDASVHDGRFANNGWLQETPGPMTKLTWDNAAIMGPATAQTLAVEHEGIVELECDGVTIELPAFVLPGVARNSVHVAMGYGRTAAGHVGGLQSDAIASVGVDVSPLLKRDGSFVLSGVRITATGRTHALATTQDHFAIDAVGFEAIGARLGELIRTGTLEEYEQQPDFAAHRGPHHPPLESLWEEPKYEGQAWGMAIDLNRCIGCNACTVACQSENNVPIVGQKQVLAGREMSWIRIDRYFAGDVEEPEVAHQPVACHHCENAPCEQVCPVAATVHSDEGLNDMVYNRCVGTRYCANNCPYKVRRFNFFNYNEQLEQPENVLQKMVLNPEVTVRSRGVMEKCTYCVQRIQDTKIDAKNERRSINDGEIQSACQVACPAQAITFGDLNDSTSAVAKAHADDRSYGMLAELNTKPRTKYLARIRNPHPWLTENTAGDHAAEGSVGTH